MTGTGESTDVMRAEVVERRKPWEEPVAVARRILDVLAGAAPEAELRMSRDDGDWSDVDLDVCAAWFRSPSVTAELVAGDTGWRASLARSRPMNIAKHSRRAPFSESDNLAAIDLTVDVAKAFPAADYGAILLELDRWPLYRDRGMQTLPAPFAEMLDWVHVLPPSVTTLIDRESLLAAPAACVEEREGGWFVMRVYDNPADHAAAGTLDRIEAVTRYLLDALGR